MSANRYAREPEYDPRRPFAGQYRGGRNGDSYNGDYQRPHSRERYRRSPSPRGRYSSPPHGIRMVEMTSRSKARPLAESGAQRRKDQIAEATSFIEETNLHLHAEEMPGRTATETMKATDHQVMAAEIEIQIEAGVRAEVGEEIDRHTMEDLQAEK
ncbi:hypothetical protein P7C71_g5971, partial [Lecanoromycetidae sp. Uapishka_2]